MNSPTEDSISGLSPVARLNTAESPLPSPHGASPIAVAVRYMAS